MVDKSVRSCWCVVCMVCVSTCQLQYCTLLVIQSYARDTHLGNLYKSLCTRNWHVCHAVLCKFFLVQFLAPDWMQIFPAQVCTRTCIKISNAKKFVPVSYTSFCSVCQGCYNDQALNYQVLFLVIVNPACMPWAFLLCSLLFLLPDNESAILVIWLKVA